MNKTQQFIEEFIGGIRDIEIFSEINERILKFIDHERNQRDNPDKFYHLGFLFLLAGEPYQSLQNYTIAVHLTQDATIFKRHRNYIQKIDGIQSRIKGYSWVGCYLLIASYVKKFENIARSQLESISSHSVSISPPLAIISGGCDKNVEENMQSYRSMLLKGFSFYRGTIISGGTRAGIAGLTGDLQEAYQESIRTIGYLPAIIPPLEEVDTRYRTLIRTEGLEFSPREPLQSWIDILGTGIQPNRVKLLGINGGRIAACEYRIALSFGAKVALVQNSGREADILLQDPFWKDLNNLVAIDPFSESIRHFLAA